MVHYSRAIRRGAKRIDTTGSIERVAHVAFANPDGTKVAVLTNSGNQERNVLLRMNGAEAEATLPASSVATLMWS
jgi:glucosylceramidase